MLALLRNVHRGIERTRHDDFSIEGLRGLTLEGKTLGVIGAGAIGTRVIELARAFRMKVLVHTDTKKKGTHDHIMYTTLKDLLEHSDIVTLHIPHTPKTHHMINAKTLAMMKRGSFLINTARGPLVDTQALSHALDSKRLAGAALDVLEGEAQLHEIHQPMKHTHHSLHDWRTLRKTHTLLKHKNVIVTPHIAFYTKESVDAILNITLENMEAFIKGKPVNNITFD
jgi:D-lactate dehydrogenase